MKDCRNDLFEFVIFRNEMSTIDVTVQKQDFFILGKPFAGFVN